MISVPSRRNLRSESVGKCSTCQSFTRTESPSCWIGTLGMWNIFDIWCEKMFCYLDRANSIKTNLQNCNLQIIRSISYKFVNWFWLNLPNWNSKKVSTSNVKNYSNLQMDIFCHFNLCHRKRNADDWSKFCDRLPVFGLPYILYSSYSLKLEWVLILII